MAKVNRKISLPASFKMTVPLPAQVNLHSSNILVDSLMFESSQTV